MKHTWIGLGIAASICILILGTRRCAEPSPSVATARSPAVGSASRSEIASDLESEAAPSARSNLSPAEAVHVPQRIHFTDADLLEKLRAAARAQAAFDLQALQKSLEELIVDGATPLQVLELMKGGFLARDPQACSGAILTLGVAIQRYNAGDTVLHVDGRAFLLAVLDALPEILPPEQGELITRIARARVNGRRVLDLSYLSKILELRRLHPDQAQAYSLLLENIAEELKGGEAYDQFYALFVNDTNDPMAVRVSLAALLRNKGGAFLPLAEEMFARAKGNADLRAAITLAIATSAPVEEAVKSLSRLADPVQLAEFTFLGSRPGALEALGAEYNDLVTRESNPTARKMLVSGMAKENEGVMLGIATTDPDPEVRIQALLTLTSGQAGSERALDTLIQAHANRGDPRSGIPSWGAVLAASNIVQHSSGAQREQAQGFLMQIAYDRRLSDEDRLSAVTMLKPLVPKGTFADLTIAGHPVE